MQPTHTPVESQRSWTASWIEPVEADDVAPAQRPAYHLATDFEVVGNVVRATLHATAHGVYEAFVNGERVGDEELAPGFSAYRRRLQVQSFDVTGSIRTGTNAIGMIVSDGWWRGQHGVIREIDAFGPTVGVLVELHLHLDDDTHRIVASGDSWRSTPSHILAADLIAGEVHDLRRRRDGWASPGADRSDWDAVLVAAHGTDQLCEPIGPPVRRIEELPARSVVERAPGRFLVDFGQNSNGWIRLGDLGPAGTELTIRYGEWLGPDGELTQRNIARGIFAEQRDLPFQTDRVISAGDGSVFEPRHSTKGFQYVSIEGHPGPLDPTAVTSIVVHSDLRPLGGFECSDERINRLHRAAVWSFRGNACEIPTDCPTRERSGWTGDWQLYVDTAAYLYDVVDWSAKWLRDLAADQFADGTVTSIVPDPSPHAPIWGTLHGSAGWGDAAVHVPWELYLASGRIDVIGAQFESMCRWVGFASGRAAAARHPSRQERNPEPLPHEQYLWDTGWHYGEWLEPGMSMTRAIDDLRADDHGPVATAYLYRSAHELAEMAKLLDRHDDADRYSTLAAHVLDAWRTEFIDGSGDIIRRTQATLTRALAFGLVPDELRQRTADRLADLVAEAGMHLGTGFLATPFLLPVLADHGHLDTAYALLYQGTEPSWLAMSDRSSTIWEDWAGLRADGSPRHSLNHYSKGAVISFLHRYVAGLQRTGPGYSAVRVAPRPGGGITSARTHHDAPHGRVEVNWQITNGVGALAIELPMGTVGEALLPDGAAHPLGPGSSHLTWTQPD